ncbi:unnamed protein product [Spirodela intermedia]|uniref:Uncharacterized protein n=1 Tax=Spirodela intermedia TaxID=51605 RepID=A0A7I8LBK6_SPIIN|nr:unnamed protein product [Spirodela intermedia]
MAGNGRGRSSGSNARLTGASISAAAAGGGSAGPMYSLRERSTRWGRCFGGLSCFGSQKRGKRVVPSSRILDGAASGGHGSGPQSAGLPSHSTALTLTPSLLAPPSSPASFTHSSLPSTAQSPSCFLSISANSPGNPSSTMFATGPYAHETQLVSPPVFSTFTTEPSTAPLTPPPELAHLTTPSSPDVPYAQFLSSAGGGAAFVSDDLQSTYPLYPGSPSGSFLSLATGTPGGGSSSSLYGQESPPTQSSRLFAAGSFSPSAESGIFFSASSAQFFLDQAAQLSYGHCHGGRRQSKACKQDAEELEAYRASFGFSADELTAAAQSYVEISDQADDCSSFTMSPFADAAAADKPCAEPWPTMERTSIFLRSHRPDSASPPFEPRGPKLRAQGRCRHYLTDEDEDEDEPHPKMWGTKGGGRGIYLSLSDAEVDYQKSKSWGEQRRIFLQGHC